jgi:uncharacterized membrane protein
MGKNVGQIDRIIRGIAGAAALVGAVALGWTSVLGVVLLVAGGILVVTAGVGFCPLYKVLGLRTVPASKS